MNELDRSRLTQERWLSLIRWLFIEAYFFQAYAMADVARVLDVSFSNLLIAFAAYTLVVTILVAVRRSWPVWLAYLTATVDTVMAVLFLSTDPLGVVNTGLVAVAAASVGVGVRRFPIFETFAYSFIIAAGIVASRIFFHQDLTLELSSALVIGSVAILPVLARAITLAPQEGGRDDAIGRLWTHGIEALPSLEADAANPVALYQSAARALAQYTGSHFGAVLLRNADDTFDLYSAVDDALQTDHLPAQGADSIAGRLIAVTQPTIWSRRDNLQARGLPDQYPQRFDSALVVPLPNASEHGAVLFAANRRSGGYRNDDRIFAVFLAREVPRALLAYAVAYGEVATRTAAMEALLAAVEAKRPGSREEAEECARLSSAIARELNWSDDAVDELRIASLLHDVGELAVPDPLLDKPSPLEPDEFDIVRQHPRVASRIIDYFNHSPIVLNAVYGHHERWDGRGYPAGLEGEAIALEARILCLADSMESMLSPKVFRPALSTTDALQEIVKASGTQFDPSVVQAFLGVLQREGPTFLERPQSPVVQENPDWSRHRVG